MVFCFYFFSEDYTRNYTTAYAPKLHAPSSHQKRLNDYIIIIIYTYSIKYVLVGVVDFKVILSTTCNLFEQFRVDYKYISSAMLYSNYCKTSEIDYEYLLISHGLMHWASQSHLHTHIYIYIHAQVYNMYIYMTAHCNLHIFA